MVCKLLLWFKSVYNFWIVVGFCWLVKFSKFNCFFIKKCLWVVWEVIELKMFKKFLGWWRWWVICNGMFVMRCLIIFGKVSLVSWLLINWMIVFMVLVLIFWGRVKDWFFMFLVFVIKMVIILWLFSGIRWKLFRWVFFCFGFKVKVV